jgi:hypothetical protein
MIGQKIENTKERVQKLLKLLKESLSTRKSKDISKENKSNFKLQQMEFQRK